MARIEAAARRLARLVVAALLGAAGCPDADPNDPSDSNDPSDPSDPSDPAAVCGDGIVQAGEGCDDGPANADDGACTAGCAAATCGDGLVWAGVEACDDGPANADDGACTAGCAAASCGDGLVWAGVEGCDDGAANDDASGCTAACVAAACGDGLLWDGVEACDDANGLGGDGCGPSCARPVVRDIATADAAIYGLAPGDDLGLGLANAGDVDGDGLDDLLVGAPYRDGGVAYLVRGPAAGATLDDALATFTAEGPSDAAGYAVAAGDLDHDGVGDVVISALSAGGTSAGRVYVLFGPFAGDVSLADADLVLVGDTPNRGLGWELWVGDLDGDGGDDLAMTEAYDAGHGGLLALTGPLSPATTTADASVVVITEGDGDPITGIAAGDVSGDGVIDLVVGSFWNAGFRGAVYVVNGPFAGEIRLQDADVKLTGERTGDKAGYTLAVGDLDGDGVMDVATGAFEHAGTGAAYVVYGPVASGPLTGADVKLEGTATPDQAGAFVGMGDFDGDGALDLGVGAAMYGGDNGALHVVYGPMAGVLQLARADVTLVGQVESYLGQNFVAGDFDGDGIQDLALTSWNVGQDAGAMYLVSGPP